MLLESLNSQFLQRQDCIEALEAGLISGHNVLLIGPAGSAKSALCRAAAATVGAKYFEIALAPTTTPEEVFGPPDIEALTQRGEWRRKIDHYAPSAEIAFFDEFFRGSPAIRDTLLSMLGEERLCYIDGLPVRVPLLYGIGATNFLDDSPEQAAILDRWCLRVEVNYVSPSQWESLLFGQNGGCPVGKCSVPEVLALRDKAKALPFEAETKEAVLDILNKLMTEHGVQVSDRRKKWSVAVARAMAVSSGHDSVMLRDLAILRHVYWTAPAQRAVVNDVVMGVACPGRLACQKLMAEIYEAYAEFSGQRSIGSAVAALAKFKEIAEQVNKYDKEDVAEAREALKAAADECRKFVTGGIA